MRSTAGRPGTRLRARPGLLASLPLVASATLDHLHADCRTSQGAWRRTQVAIDACRKFANDDGHLVCE